MITFAGDVCGTLCVYALFSMYMFVGREVENLYVKVYMWGACVKKH